MANLVPMLRKVVFTRRTVPVFERITTVSAIPEFSDGGYRYSPERSTPNEPVFLRRSD